MAMLQGRFRWVGAARWLVGVALLTGCGESDDGAASGGAGGGGGTAGTGGAAGGFSLDPLGGERPVTPFVPASYQPGAAMPLVILLHGYGAGGFLQETVVFQLKPLAEELGFIYLTPDGTKETGGRGVRFWNATDACCDFYGSGVDDVAYLSGLVEEASGRFSIDPKRVYFVGHSNGGYMAHRLACDRADLVAGIVSLAGSTWGDASRCQPSEPVSMLQIHGVEDATVEYSGGGLGGGLDGGVSFPGAEETTTRWRDHDGCGTTPPTPVLRDYNPDLAGEETEVTVWSDGCQAGSAAALWKMNGAGHVPSFNEAARRALVAFLLDHPKP